MKSIFQSKKFALLLLILGLAFTDYIYASAQEEKPIIILPSDDAYVLADLSDPTDTSGLMQTNAGNLDSIQLFSSWNATENNNAIVTIGYLKFDTSKQNNYNLEKAELKMLTREVALSETPKNVVVVHASNNNWKESDITYLKRPTFSTTITSSAAIATPNTWYSWDVTDLVKQNPGSELSVAVTFDVAKDNTQDFVSFYSKEFPNKDNAPYLALTYSSSPMPLFDSGNQGASNFVFTVLISGIIGAIIGGFTTKVILSRTKQKSPQSDFKQPSTPPDKIQCKNCSKILPKQFKFCPFCSTQI